MKVIFNNKFVLVLTNAYGYKETVIGVEVMVEGDRIPRYFVDDESALSLLCKNRTKDYVDPEDDYSVEMINDHSSLASDENILQAIEILGWKEVEPIFTKYEAVQNYGGSEEGGWYYDTVHAIEEVTRDEFFEFCDEDLTDSYGEGPVYGCGIIYGSSEKTDRQYYC